MGSSPGNRPSLGDIGSILSGIADAIQTPFMIFGTLIALIALFVQFGGLLIGDCPLSRFDWATSDCNPSHSTPTPIIITATPKPRIDKPILFVGIRDNVRQLFKISKDGEDLGHIVLPNDIEIYDPVWSPDGNSIAFSSNGDVYILSLSNPELKLIDGIGEAAHPTWSPSGDALAFSSKLDGDDEIYILFPENGILNQVTNNDSDDNEPDWSPDGKSLVFDSQRDGASSIFTINIDGSNEQRLTDNRSNSYDPAWSPDGHRIAFSSDRTGNSEIFVSNLDGSNPQNLTNHHSSDYAPTWSPDGKYIAFESFRDGSNNIYMMHNDGSDQKNLTRSRMNNYTPDW